MTNSILAATFSDFRLVRGRKVAQLILEIPIEQAEAALHLFGMPMPDRERWVAIAPMVGDPNAAPASPPAEQAAIPRDRKEVQSHSSDYDRSERQKLSTEGERAVTRAAILCEQPQFQRWFGCPTTAEAAAKMRMLIRGSRSTIATDRRAFEEFLKIETQYRADSGRLAERR